MANYSPLAIASFGEGDHKVLITTQVLCIHLLLIVKKLDNSYYWKVTAQAVFKTACCLAVLDRIYKILTGQSHLTPSRQERQVFAQRDAWSRFSPCGFASWREPCL
jgi:hypothetical protein